MDTKGYYKSLGVNEKATDEEIKKSFKKLSLRYHPDRQVNKSDDEKKNAEEKFKEINEAYQVLSDPEKRQNYDRYGSPDAKEGFGGGDPFSGMGDPFDMFGSFFGGGRQRASQPPVENGTDITMAVPLTIEEVFNGCKKKLKYKKKVVCQNCHGDGGSGKKQCPHCNGTGMITETQRTGFGIFRNSHPCQYCNGTGYTIEHTCPTCNGSGFTTKENIVEVEFPAGMPEEYGISKEGEGNATKDKRGVPGNFYAIPKYAFDKNRYRINGLDVMETISIPYYDHYLGCDYIVEIPDGTKKKITISPNLKDGHILRLPKCGIKGTGNDLKGDYYVEIHVDLPMFISEKEQNLLKEIKKLHKTNS